MAAQLQCRVRKCLTSPRSGEKQIDRSLRPMIDLATVQRRTNAQEDRKKHAVSNETAKLLRRQGAILDLNLAPRVSGYIGEVLVGDNQSVKVGQVLARIDDRDLKTALAQAQADVASAQNGIANLVAPLSLQQSLIAQANTDIGSSEAARNSPRKTSSVTRIC